MSLATAPTWEHDGTKATEGEVLELLYALVRSTKPERCLETGTFAGHGAKAISNALVANDRGSLITIEFDPELAAALREIELPRTRFVEADSYEWVCEDAFGAFDFIFVDCGEWEHRVEVAAVAYELLAPRGLMLCHDTTYYPDLKGEISERIGRAGIEVFSLHGLSIWQRN
jgi:predicted O-methyltransferase YrrM